MEYKQYTLKNGLRVILVPVKEMTTATVIAVVGTGSRYENETENGLAHFLEHMFFKGTKRRPKAEIIARELDALGASYNAYTAKDRTGYYAKVASDKIMGAMDVIHDLFLHSTLPQKEITKESGAILQEINMYADQPSRTVYNEFEALLYGSDHPLGRTVLGPKENITSFTRKDFQSYLKRCYGARNTVLCVAGKFSQKKVLDKIRKDFADLDAGEKISCEPYATSQTVPQLHINPKKTDQSHMIIGVRTKGTQSNDRYILNVLANILGGGMSSRLFSEVREKRGLAYSIGASMDFAHETGALIAYAGVEHANLAETVKIILKEMKKIATRGVTDEELERAQSGFAGRIAFGYETSDDIAEHFAEQEVLRGEIILPTQTLEKIQKVTQEDIKRVAKEIFVNEGLNLAVIGTQKKKEKEIASLLHF
jgi:predicted Zn-dependent peptidase